jgi:hypothetical protein
MFVSTADRGSQKREDRATGWGGFGFGGGAARKRPTSWGIYKGKSYIPSGPGPFHPLPQIYFLFHVPTVGNSWQILYSNQGGVNLAPHTPCNDSGRPISPCILFFSLLSIGFAHPTCSIGRPISADLVGYLFSFFFLFRFLSFLFPFFFFSLFLFFFCNIF